MVKGEKETCHCCPVCVDSKVCHNFSSPERHDSSVLESSDGQMYPWMLAITDANFAIQVSFKIIHFQSVRNF